MIKFVTYAAVALLFAPIALAERADCPTGESGDWRWQVGWTMLQLKNDKLAMNWDTVGPDVTSTGLEVNVNTTPDGVRGISFDILPLGIDVTQERVDKEPLKFGLFSVAERGKAWAEYEFRPNQHDYVGTGYLTADDKLMPVFNSRVEQWETDDREITIKWNGFDHPVDWGFVEKSPIRFGLNTTALTPYNQRSWQIVALSDPFDLSVLKPAIAEARAAQNALPRDQSCEMNYRF